jgi:tetratricopeptide (TPR) repeat protein
MYIQMKRYFYYLLLALLPVLPGCVKNPNITDDVFLGTPGATKNWVTGLKRQLALTVNAVVINAETVSDNYFNNYTQNSKVFDIPQIDYYDVDVNTIQVRVQQLRVMAEYGLTTVATADKATIASEKAFMLFCEAYARILSGELFTGLPGTNLGAVLTPQQHLQQAIALLDEAIATEPDATNKLSYTLLKARAYYGLGDATNASKYATEAIAKKDLLLQVAFDGLNGVSNDMQTAVYDAVPNRFAPLPRLDFLDPKYYYTGVAASNQKPVAIVKAEEGYLVLAEAQLSAGSLGVAKQTLKDLLTDVISKRPLVQVDDKNETRGGGNRKDYPLTAVKVKFDAADAARDGYVLNRQAGNVPVYIVSGTKVTAADIDATATQDDLLYLLYRLRQEIFFSEGRRMTDLGIKWPVSQTEQLNNKNVTAEHIKSQIPSFIPLSRGMDDFTNDVPGGVVTMKYDMNKVLVQNKTAKEIFPFIN